MRSSIHVSFAFIHSSDIFLKRVCRLIFNEIYILFVTLCYFFQIFGFQSEISPNFETTKWSINDTKGDLAGFVSRDKTE